MVHSRRLLATSHLQPGSCLRAGRLPASSRRNTHSRSGAGSPGSVLCSSSRAWRPSRRSAANWLSKYGPSVSRQRTLGSSTRTARASTRPTARPNEEAAKRRTLAVAAGEVVAEGRADRLIGRRDRRAGQRPPSARYAHGRRRVLRACVKAWSGRPAHPGGRSPRPIRVPGQPEVPRPACGQQPPQKARSRAVCSLHACWHRVQAELDGQGRQGRGLRRSRGSARFTVGGVSCVRGGRPPASRRARPRSRCGRPWPGGADARAATGQRADRPPTRAAR